MPQGYLGPKSYSAVFRENQLVDCQREDSPATGVHADFNVQTSTATQCNLESPRHVEEGIAVLDLLPSFDLCQRLLNRHFAIADSLLHEQSTKRCHNSMWTSYRSALQPPRHRQSLQRMSQELCKNGMSVSISMPPLASEILWICCT